MLRKEVFYPLSILHSIFLSAFIADYVFKIMHLNVLASFWLQVLVSKVVCRCRLFSGEEYATFHVQERGKKIVHPKGCNTDYMSVIIA